MYFLITKSNGAVYSSLDYSIKVTDFHISPPKAKTTYEEIDGLDGGADIGTLYEPRTITVKFFVEANDDLDFPLLRDELFALLDSKEAFYLQDSRVLNKRWFGKVNDYKLEQIINVWGEGELTFTVASAFAESTATTLEALSSEVEKWGFGQGLTFSDTEEIEYTHTTSQFEIYNAGNRTVDPRKSELIISFACDGTNPTITNDTTGEQWGFVGALTTSDTIVIDGVKTKKNGVSCFKDTNRKLITLAPGMNSFTIANASNITISFNFRFLYL